MPVPTEFIQVSLILSIKHTTLTRFVALTKCKSVNVVRLDPPSDTDIWRRTENQLLQQHQFAMNRPSPRCHRA